MIRKFSIILMMAMAVTACHRVQPVYNVEGDAIPAAAQQKLSSEQVGKIIRKAALAKGWLVKEAKPGLLHCTLEWRGHTAEIDIAYSREDYSIELDSSENLKESNGNIHYKYNKRVQELQAEIDRRLSRAVYK